MYISVQYVVFTLEQLSDWYGVSRQEVMYRGGKNLFKKYSSLEQLLRAVYPDFAWDSALFPQFIPPGYWQHQENIAQALERAEQSLGITRVG